ncbi:MAG: ankyrin repeat domain-containing protein [Pyrinomonadaceae bacterium]
MLRALHRRDLECVKFLLAAGADPNEPRDPYDRTASHRPAFEAIHSHRLDLLAAVVEGGADIEATDGAPQATFGGTGLTLLCWATFNASQDSTKGDIELVRYLLSRGAQVDHGKADGFTPFMFATEGGRMDLIELLFNAGADVNTANISGVTPLMAAGDFPEVVEYLLNRGANMDARISEGYSIICHAMVRKHTKKVATLVAHGAASDPACRISSEP